MDFKLLKLLLFRAPETTYIVPQMVRLFGHPNRAGNVHFFGVGSLLLLKLNKTSMWSGRVLGHRGFCHPKTQLLYQLRYLILASADERE